MKIEQKKRKRRLPSKKAQKELLREVDSVVGRPAMISALETIAPSNQKAELLWSMLLDPTFARESLPSLAKKCDLSFVEIHDLFRQAKVLEGTIKVYEDFPNLMADVRDDARTTLRTCPKCNGRRRLHMESRLKSEPCPECDGKGKVRVIGDKDSRRHILEMAGLIGKQGPLIQQQINVAGQESLEDTIGSASSLVRVQRPQLEGETK